MNNVRRFLQHTGIIFIILIQVLSSTGYSFAQTLSSAGSSAGAFYQFSRTLTVGSVGDDVRELQRWLNQNGFTIASSGPGSLGNETRLYGAQTARAVKKFQETYRAQILSSAGLSEGTGRFAAATRTFLNNAIATNSSGRVLGVSIGGGKVLGETTGGQTIFTTQVPNEVHQSDGANVNYDLGTRFRPTENGTITAIRFWKDSYENGTHVGRIWKVSNKSLLATVMFSGETTSGWQEQALSTPLSVTAGTDYVVTVNTTNAYYASTTHGLDDQVVNGDLKTSGSSNGLYGDIGKYPTKTYSKTNYFRDVRFVSGTAPSADTTAPSVSLTAPANGATVSGTVSVSASASDNTGVSGVTFKYNGTTIGAEDTTSGYAVSWDTTTIPNGTYSLTAVARDAAGNTATANGVTVTVNNVVVPPPDTVLPVVSLTSPASGATVSGSAIVLSASAADNVGVTKVQFQIDAANINGADTTSPYQVSWDSTTTSNGTHTLTAVAYDAAGNSQVSNSVVVTVANVVPDTSAPAVSFSAPANGATVSGTATTLSVAASDNIGVVGVQFKIDGSNIGSQDTTSPYSISWNTTTVPNGAHTLSAVASDAAGNTATATQSISVNNAVAPAPDTSAPSVSVTAPANGATVSGTTTLSATATDNIGVAGVTFKVDGANVGSEDTTSPYSISWNTTAVSNGTHTVTAVARDAAGNTKTSSGVTVTVSNTTGSTGYTLVYQNGYNTSSDITSNQLGLGSISTSVYKTGPGSFKSVVDQTSNISNGYRSEQQYDGATYNPTEGAVEYDVMYESPFDSNGHSIQWHPNTSGASATLALWHSGGQFQVVRSVQYGVNIYQSGTLKTIERNKWYHMRWEYKFSTGTDGYVRLYIDGALYYSATGKTADGSGQYLKVGQNRWNVDSTSVAYYDNLQIYKGSAGTTPPPTGDTTAPSVSFSAPASGAIVSGSATTVTASASDNVGVAGVQFKVDGVNIGSEDTTSPYSISWNTTTVPNGAHTLSAVARDAAGNTTTATRSVTVSNTTAPAPDTTAPSISVTSPIGASILSGSATIAATASDNIGVAGVTFKVDGVNIGSEDTSAPYSVSWDTTTATNATHTVTAVARDTAGNVTTSTAITVSVSNTTTPPPTGGDNSGPCSTALSYSGYSLAYCTGYDTVADLDPYDNGQLGNGSLSTTIYKTGPGSFKSVPANVSSGIRSEVQYDSNETPNEGIVEYDVRYDTVCQNSCHSLQWHPQTSGGSASPGLWHENGKFVLVNWKNGTNTKYPSGMLIETGKWYHIKLAYKFGSAGYLHFYVDGVLKIDANNIQVGDGSGQYLKVGVNMWVNQQSVVYYDNLRVYKKN